MILVVDALMCIGIKEVYGFHAENVLIRVANDLEPLPGD